MSRLAALWLGVVLLFLATAVHSHNLGRTQIAGVESFTHNTAGWITGETAAGWTASYGYRIDGGRQSQTLNGQTASFHSSPGGRVERIDNPVLGARLAALTPAERAAPDIREEIDYNAQGRVSARHLMGRDAAGRVLWQKDFGYQYDILGRLSLYTDHQDPANCASYTYDYDGRRVLMTVGVTSTRMVYEDDDVVAEWVDEDGDGQYDRYRWYWLLPAIDQRLGFADFDANGNLLGIYYYLCDAIGSVVQIVDSAGTVVNQYDYDAFGNIRWPNSFEGVANRYTFQGREYDAHAGHYYYRMRTYIPEWGTFTGPDMDIRVEGEGVCTYVFALSNPLDVTDPSGMLAVMLPLWAWGDRWADHLARMSDETTSPLRAVLYSGMEDVTRHAANANPIDVGRAILNDYEGYPKAGVNTISAGAASTSLKPLLMIHDALVGYSSNGMDMGQLLDGVQRWSRGLTGVGTIALMASAVDGKPVMNYRALLARIRHRSTAANSSTVASSASKSAGAASDSAPRSVAGAVDDIATTPLQKQLGGISDDALVHFSPGEYPTVKPGAGGELFTYRYGDIKHLTPRQVETLIGPLAKAGDTGGARVIHVLDTTIDAATTRPGAVVPDFTEYILTKPVKAPGRVQVQ